MSYSQFVRLVLDHLLYFSCELEKARTFHVDVLGCSVENEEAWGFIFLRLPEGGHIGLMHPRNWGGWSEGDPLPEPVLCLRTDDLPEAIAELSRRGARLSEPDGEAGQARGCRLTDPGGRTIYIFEDPSEPLP